MVTNRHGVSWPWSGVRAAIVRRRWSSASLGPGPTISRGFAERRVSRSESGEERSLSIVVQIEGAARANNVLHKRKLLVTVAADPGERNKDGRHACGRRTVFA